MAKGSGGTRGTNSRTAHPPKERDWFQESQRAKANALDIADSLKGNPLRFHSDNGISMKVELTKSDLKTIVSKATSDNKFNTFKNTLAKDIPGFLKKAKYEGWREVIEGKHPEAAYFAYYSREYKEKAYLCVRKMKGGFFKPYAIINQAMFNAEIGKLRKGKPPE